jgi:hypothetical protein
MKGMSLIELMTIFDQLLMNEHKQQKPQKRTTPSSAVKLQAMTTNCTTIETKVQQIPGVVVMCQS